ncbi:hypothetical protein CSOJ01_06324 [Colletotrichum sojae]|uniref:Uncharacterized protein n=1 Tax=Colletotrichum sojae TaxID=2175907 RepID=A0A8H6MVH3_9PEZI|nr:hypothetical protein CSOJ01_06324 [Colletotrichum sojae]
MTASNNVVTGSNETGNVTITGVYCRPVTLNTLRTGVRTTDTWPVRSVGAITQLSVVIISEDLYPLTSGPVYISEPWYGALGDGGRSSLEGIAAGGCGRGTNENVIWGVSSVLLPVIRLLLFITSPFKY